MYNTDFFSHVAFAGRCFIEEIPRYKNGFSIRLHPSQGSYKQRSNKNLHIDLGTDIWELDCAMGNVSSQSVLLGFSSSALVTPKMLFDKEPTVICLYRLVSWEEKQSLGELDDFFTFIQSCYRDKKKFIIVNDLQELAKILQSTRTF